ncbi:MAG: methyltransferase domain-containing protein [Ignavibacteriae bacterium]|nr:methyltransferase domain-containing protein [Ignavibacteriota bacterium]
MNSFQQFEHEGWERVADNYSTTWISLTTQFIEPLLDAAGVRKGNRVLDIACGPGQLAVAASQRGASAVGADFSKNMVRIARQLHPEIEFIESDAERLPFPAGMFDSVLINFGVLHFARPERVFAEVRRVLARGGTVGFTVWADTDMNEGGRIMNEAMKANADFSVQIPEGPPVFLFGNPDECRKTLEAAGFNGDALRFTTKTVLWRVPTARYLVDAERDAGVRTGGILKHQTPERLEAIRVAVEKQVERHAVNGGYEIPMTAHLISASAR